MGKMYMHLRFSVSEGAWRPGGASDRTILHFLCTYSADEVCMILDSMHLVKLEGEVCNENVQILGGAKYNPG